MRDHLLDTSCRYGDAHAHAYQYQHQHQHANGNANNAGSGSGPAGAVGHEDAPMSMSVTAETGTDTTGIDIAGTTRSSTGMAGGLSGGSAGTAGASAGDGPRPVSVSVGIPVLVAVHGRGGQQYGFGFGFGANNAGGSIAGTAAIGAKKKRPLASLNANAATGTATDTTINTTTTTSTCTAGIYNPYTDDDDLDCRSGLSGLGGLTSSHHPNHHRMPHRSTTCSMPHPTSNSRGNKRTKIQSLPHLRKMLAQKALSAIRQTPHNESSRPYSVVTECLSMHLLVDCCGDGGGLVPYGLFFTQAEAMTRLGWEVRVVESQQQQQQQGTTGTYVGSSSAGGTVAWTLYGNAASDWMRSALEGEGLVQQQPQPSQTLMTISDQQQQQQPQRPFHVHPVKFDGPVHVTYGGYKRRTVADTYAYAGIEALEATYDVATRNLVLTVRTYLAGVVDKDKDKGNRTG